MSQAIQTLQKILIENRYSGKGGVYCVCSSLEEVILSALKFTKDKSYPLVIESTSNQVNQYGGYTGMNPQQFADYVYRLAEQVSFPHSRIVLGGDHLGPNVWQNEPAQEAMDKSQVLVQDYIKAGYRKIHLDASMACADDEVKAGIGIGDELVAKRAAILCKTAEDTWQSLTEKGEHPVYIIGTEVPVPGGSKENEDHITPTEVNAARNTYEITKSIFAQEGLEEAWQRVIAMVVQPGVEFSDENIFYYQPEKSKELSRLCNIYNISFEAHSTDYQTSQDLQNLVNNHYAILKVGPWLTYAYREALLALSFIEQDMIRLGLLKAEPSSLSESLLQYLLAHPQHWEKYYHGTPKEIEYKCLYSLSDRIRYYWPQKDMQAIINKLFVNLQQTTLPYSLVSQYFPQAVDNISQDEWSPEVLIEHHIQPALAKYEFAIC